MGRKAIFWDEVYGSFSAVVADVLAGHGHRERGYAQHAHTAESFAKLLVDKERKDLTLDLSTFRSPEQEARFVDVEHGEFWQLPSVIRKGGRHPARFKLDPTKPELELARLLDVPVYRKRIQEIQSEVVRPDFKLSPTLFVEADGLYWHSTLFKKPNHHQRRRQLFEQHGLRVLQFYSDEILFKGPIVQSMVFHLLGRSQRIGARTLRVGTLEGTEFFETNHLMGYTAARQLALFDSNAKPLAAFSFKITKGVLNIERYATALGTSVPGGFHRLLRAALKQNPDVRQVVNFVDLRYGTGKHLPQMGFFLKNETLGWRWTDFQTTYNRRQCRANMDDRGLTEAQQAAEKKWFRIYDAGQAQYVLNLEKTDS